MNRRERRAAEREQEAKNELALRYNRRIEMSMRQAVPMPSPHMRRWNQYWELYAQSTVEQIEEKVWGYDDAE